MVSGRCFREVGEFSRVNAMPPCCGASRKRIEPVGSAAGGEKEYKTAATPAVHKAEITNSLGKRSQTHSLVITLVIFRTAEPFCVLYFRSSAFPCSCLWRTVISDYQTGVCMPRTSNVFSLLFLGLAGITFGQGPVGTLNGT